MEILSNNKKNNKNIRDYPKLKYNKHTYRDLEIGTKILDNIDYTITKFGRLKLANRLHYIHTDLMDLHRLGEKIQKIREDQDYISKVRNSLNKIKDIELNLDDWMNQKPDQSLLYKYNFLNNRFVLTISNKMKFSSVFIIFIFYLFVYVFLLYLGIPISIYDYGKSIIDGYHMLANFILSYFFENKDFIKYGGLFIVTAYIGYQMYMFYQSINTCIEHYDKCNNFYKEYETINELIKQIRMMIKSDKYFLENDKKEEIKQSLEYLEYYFSSDSSLGFSIVSKISIFDYIGHMNKIVNYIGRVDMWTSIVTLIEQDGFSLPNYLIDEDPTILAKGLWNPMIKKDEMIKNNVNINKINLTIITGPNKAGKSTYMRSILTSIYLAQSIGVTCCDYLEFTPFFEMFTYLNVPDSIGRESLFEAEINRCHEYLERIEKCQNQNLLTIGLVDELFTGTNPKEGMAGSYAVVNKLKNIKTNMTILSTHFHDICNLKDHKIKFVKFIANKEYLSNNPYKYKYIFPYKVYKGISDQCIALELLKEKGFCNEIVDSAFNYLNNKSKN